VNSIIYHDFGENGVGDVPYPAKRESPALKEAMDALETKSLFLQGVTLTTLGLEIRNLIKIADLLEMAEFALHEIRMGNTFAHPVRDRTLKNVRLMLDEYVFEENVHYNITNFMETLNV
jgi:5'-deoxynucleotidase YfbR-like HD superfamily hydrolase